jgi:hypothetical protein
MSQYSQPHVFDGAGTFARPSFRCSRMAASVELRGGLGKQHAYPLAAGIARERAGSRDGRRVVRRSECARLRQVIEQRRCRRPAARDGCEVAERFGDASGVIQ